MYKIILHGLFFLFTNCVLAQNLIYNGDFELYDSCPTNPSTPGDLQIEHCLGWTSPRKIATSDYFNVCNNPINGGLAGVPQNGLGYQFPYNGNGYCGFFAWSPGWDLNGNVVQYSEYLQTKLYNRLKYGQGYSFSMYVSYSGYNYSVEKIGMLFSSENYNENSYTPITANPQIVNSAGTLKDSLNWKIIEGFFFADGTEEYLTIGYFEDSLKISDTLNTYNEVFIKTESYYYVDGLELIETEVLIPNVFTPNDDLVNDNFELDFYFDSFVILNRWGEKIFETTEDNRSWNGVDKNGEKVTEGSYFYVIHSGKLKLTGFVQVLR